MAIPRMSSKDLNKILMNAQNTIDSVKNDMNDLIRHTDYKMGILRNEQEYALSKIEGISELLNKSSDHHQLKGVRNKIVFKHHPNIKGVFDRYGATIHQKFLRPPINIFNLMTVNGPIFRDNMEVRINGEKKEVYKNMLKHHLSNKKEDLFLELASPNATIDIEIDRSNLLGNTDFNVIEINPFLPGSFHIKELRIYDINSQKEEPDHVIKNLGEIGQSRLVLERKYELSKIEMEIEITFQNSVGKYPFGLKHLYFLNADFDPDSYVIAKIEKSNYIETISEEIFIHDQYGKRLTNTKDEGIKLYLNEENGILEYELETSKHHEERPIAQNTNSFFVRMPLKHSAVYSIEFDKIKTR